MSGTADVLVTGHGTETATLPLLIIEKEGPCLLGRNWLKSLRLDWRRLIRVHHLQDNPALTEVLLRHPHVFDEGLYRYSQRLQSKDLCGSISHTSFL